MIVHNFEQLSEEWHNVRTGIPTASCFDCIITTKAEPSKQKDKYLYTLAGERITGKSEATYQSAAMLRGCEIEAEARRFYEVVSDAPVNQVGFCLSDCRRYGASPDALVGDDGLLEIKCPIMSNHVKYLVKNSFVTDYFQQVQGGLFVTGRKWTDFLSYYPGMKPLLIRVERDEEFIDSLRQELDAFCQELEEVVLKLKEAR